MKKNFIHSVILYSILSFFALILLFYFLSEFRKMIGNKVETFQMSDMPPDALKLFSTNAHFYGKGLNDIGSDMVNYLDAYINGEVRVAVKNANNASASHAASQINDINNLLSQCVVDKGSIDQDRKTCNNDNKNLSEELKNVITTCNNDNKRLSEELKNETKLYNDTTQLINQYKSLKNDIATCNANYADEQQQIQLLKTGSNYQQNVINNPVAAPVAAQLLLQLLLQLLFQLLLQLLFQLLLRLLLRLLLQLLLQLPLLIFHQLMLIQTT